MEKWTCMRQDGLLGATAVRRFDRPEKITMQAARDQGLGQPESRASWGMQKQN